MSVHLNHQGLIIKFFIVVKPVTAQVVAGFFVTIPETVYHFVTKL